MLVKCNNVYPKVSGVFVNFKDDKLPPFSIRLKYRQGTTPTFSKGNGVLYDAAQNIWDLTYENTDWRILLQEHSNLLEVIKANTAGVTHMANMFGGCSSLTTVALFDTSSVTNMLGMFYECSSLTTVPLFDTSNVWTMEVMLAECSSLTSVPLFDTSNVNSMRGMLQACTSLTTVPLFETSKVIHVTRMCKDCFNIQSGALAMYQQLSTQTNPPTYYLYAFENCGINTETGAAELAQIPDDWK